MKWNWQKPDWPDFRYKSEALERREQEFLHSSGLLFGAYKHLDWEDRDKLKIEIISNEALKTSEIEGEYLDRDSLQSSIRRHFGLQIHKQDIKQPEEGITDIMVNLYDTCEDPLSHEMLHHWHYMLTFERDDLRDIGRYRTGREPMEIVSGPLHRRKIHFVAPPASQVKKEMNRFVRWFNRTSPDGKSPLPALTRAGITHLYFECIHPFEDGNGRIGRMLSEKVLAQACNEPTLIALATIIERDRKAYYDALGRTNKKNEITQWLVYFADMILEALHYTQTYIKFLIEKTKLLPPPPWIRNGRQGDPEGFGCSARAFVYMYQQV